MAKEKKDNEGTDEPVVNVLNKKGDVDLTIGVEVIATDKAPYHAEGEVTKVAPVVAEKMIKNGWAIAAK